MSNDILITDNRLTFSTVLAELLTQRSYKVVLTGEGNNTIQWNRNSPFALQHLNLLLKNAGSTFHTAVVVFDAIEYASLYASNTLIALDRTATELINAYLHFSLVAQAIITKQETGRLIFVLRSAEELTDNLGVSVATVAFAKLAENTAVTLAAKKMPNVQSLLVRLENPDTESAAWLAGQLELPVITKNVSKWVKAGQRGLFAK